MQVGFLFNHEALHQAAHSAPIAFELSRRHPQITVKIFASTDAELDYVRSLGREFPGAECVYVKTRFPLGYRLASAAVNKALPLKRWAVLKANVDVFRALDALVVPEKTSLMLKTRFGLEHLKLVHTRHGAGDRAIGFDGHNAGFDFVLLSGRKVRDRLLDAGVIRPEGYSIVGYPKFDVTRPADAARRRLFDNDRPTVLYNPHYDPNLSSWYRMGRDVLEFFYRSRSYNLIFAPHCMLFRRKVHVGSDGRSVAYRPGVPAKYRSCAHMLVDTGSLACTDLTYTMAADIYLGDVSSQVYEFLVEPRPCLFLNARGVRWQDDPNYLHWNLGPVVGETARLEDQLATAFARHAYYRGRQQRYFAYTFDLRDVPSSVRAADAVAEYLLGATAVVPPRIAV